MKSETAKQTPLEGRARQAAVGSLKLILLYAAFAGLWILLSDLAVEWLLGNPAQRALAQTLKGLLFVAVTSVLVYVLMRRLAGQIRDAARREHDAQTEKLRALQLLEAVVDSSTDTIFAKDVDDRFIVFNRAAEHLTGKQSAEIMGRDEMAIFPPELARQLIADNRRVMAEDRVITFQEELVTAQGDRTYMTTKGPMHDAEGRRIGMFGTARDISDLKRAEDALRESEAKFRTMIEMSPVALAMYDEHQNITLLNPKFVATFGYTLAELPNLAAWWPLAYPDPAYRQRAAQEWQAAVAKAQQDGTALEPMEFAVTRKDGSVRDIRFSLAPMGGSSLVIFYDITERKLAEQKVLAQLDELLRWQRLTIGREERMLQLKAEVNELLARLGEAARYPGQAD